MHTFYITLSMSTAKTKPIYESLIAKKANKIDNELKILVLPPKSISKQVFSLKDFHTIKIFTFTERRISLSSLNVATVLEKCYFYVKEERKKVFEDKEHYWKLHFIGRVTKWWKRRIAVFPMTEASLDLKVQAFNFVEDCLITTYIQ